SGLNAGADPLLLAWPHVSWPSATPLLEYMFDIHTNAGAPWKSPVPPRSWFFWSPVMSQLKPMRGENCQFPDGILVVLIPVSESTSRLKPGFVRKIGTSARTPYSMFSLLFGCHLS